MKASAAHEVDVAATAAACFAILVDVPGYPAWWPGLSSAEVLRPGDEPEIRLVFAPPMVGDIDLLLRLHPEPPTHVGLTLLGGRLKRLEGPGWTLRDEGSGRCRVRYEIEAEMDTGLPGFLERSFASQAGRFLVAEPVEALKRRAETG